MDSMELALEAIKFAAAHRWGQAHLAPVLLMLLVFVVVLSALCTPSGHREVETTYLPAGER